MTLTKTKPLKGNKLPTLFCARRQKRTWRATWKALIEFNTCWKDMLQVHKIDREKSSEKKETNLTRRKNLDQKQFHELRRHLFFLSPHQSLARSTGKSEKEFDIWSKVTFFYSAIDHIRTERERMGEIDRDCLTQSKRDHQDFVSHWWKCAPNR